MTRMAANALGLRPAQPADIPFIMATERTPGFEKLVGRWSETDHRTALGAKGYAYLVATDAARQPAAFAIVRDIDDAHGNVCLKRIAVTAPGQGVGRRVFDLVVDWIFTQTPAYRLWLDVLADNARARHVYRTSGFAEEGVMRDAYKLPDESRIDLVLMSLLRPDWTARR
jgi:RimJ/RimL family protein N-acetyltransferase